MKRFWILILVAGIAIIAMSAHQYLTRLSAGDMAPQFELTSTNGEVISLKKLAGRPVIVHFWATWCGVCRSEFPSLVRMHEAFKDTDLAVLGLSEDNSRAEIDSFLRAVPVTFPVLMDTGNRVADMYGSYGVPESFFIDRGGKIVGRVNNSINWDDKVVRAKVDELIAGR